MATVFSFELLGRDKHTAARLGRIQTPHGKVDLPAFMPVGTQGAVRCLRPDEVRRAGAEIILANTYHLHLKPGENLVEKAGGLHRFIGWDRPILTDSGGFQVFSLPKKEISNEGVRFRFRKGGEETLLTPEKSVQIQSKLGADILMAFDECVPYPAPKDVARQGVERTVLWAGRCLKTFGAPKGKALFGIVQGSTYSDLREECAERLSELDFHGFAIGGVSVGEGTERMLHVVDETAPRLPTDKPRYVMGVGKPEEILQAVALGVDMFDCVIPTRHARGGLLYTVRGPIRIRNRRYRRDFYPVDRSCHCSVCTRFTRAYLRHLYEAGEVLGRILGSIHNTAFYQELMDGARRAIKDGRFAAYKRNFLAEYLDGEQR
ncbi:MAG: tRNA guanosine(34) transglycosylase Tgt [Planctomycetota bacterium]|jgi:queuine tRNA-ribosyltransferase